MNYDPFVTKGFTKICSRSDLRQNAGKRFIVDETDVAVFLVNDTIYAVSNICPHKQSALIFDGFLEGDNIVCPVHGWMFNLKNGKTPTGNNGLRIFETMIKGNDVYIKIEERKYNW